MWKIEKQIRLTKDYEWTAKEISTEDSPLIELINFGINRVKYASDIVIAVLNELKIASTANKCKVLVAIDGFNAFFTNDTCVKNDSKQIMPTSKISLTQAFLDITKSDWCNGEVIVTVDQYATKVSEYKQNLSL